MNITYFKKKILMRVPTYAIGGAQILHQYSETFQQRVKMVEEWSFAGAAEIIAPVRRPLTRRVKRPRIAFLLLSTLPAKFANKSVLSGHEDCETFLTPAFFHNRR